MPTTQQAKIKELEKRTQLRQARDEELAAKKEAEVAMQEARPRHNKDHLVQVVCAILAADKQRINDLETTVNKAKQVLDYVNG